jgi:arabinofuranosyltransferase
MVAYDRILLGSRLLLFLVFSILLLNTAWLCDDAFITFRVADNWLHGHGLRWNVIERVQVYTNPLWLLLVSGVYGLTREMYFTPLLLNIALSLFTYWLLIFKIGRDPVQLLFVGGSLLASRAFIDFSTSGMENALAHALIGLFFYLFYVAANRLRNAFWIFFLAALGMVNRLDAALLYAPLLVALFFECPGVPGKIKALLGLSPLAVWLLFALVYYGSPIPNTFYAKQNAGIPGIEYFAQGILYLQDALRNDPVTLLFILVAIVGPIVSRLQREFCFASIGLLTHLAYILYVGGDFMAGRFFSTPLILACCVLLRSPGQAQGVEAFAPWRYALALAGVAVFCLYSLYGPRDNDRIRFSGISDERYAYYEGTGLLRNLGPEEVRPDFSWVREGLQVSGQTNEYPSKVFTRFEVGMFGFFAGSSVYVIDICALADPFLSRLPAKKPWRIGHLRRALPPGYVDSRILKQNRLKNPALAELYDLVVLVTQGELFSAARWRAIWRLNAGEAKRLASAAFNVK